MYKIIGGTIWFLGLILCLFTSTTEWGEFSFVAFLLGYLGVFLYGLLFWSIGIIFEELERIRNMIYSIRKGPSSPSWEDSMKNNKEQVSPKMTPSIGGQWECRKCGTDNSSSSIVCKGCGNYR